jgi:hypothetical protein
MTWRSALSRDRNSCPATELGEVDDIAAVDEALELVPQMVGLSRKVRIPSHIPPPSHVLQPYLLISHPIPNGGAGRASACQPDGAIARRADSGRRELRGVYRDIGRRDR